MNCRVIEGDLRLVLPTLDADSFGSCVTDPPYELGFMGKSWDATGVAFRPGTWSAVLRVLKPGAYLLAFGGTRTYHRLTCAVEDGGFEIRDCLLWLYGAGFPKGDGCLKPAWEPIVLARKPGKKVLPLGINECRVPANGETLGGGRTTGSVGQTAHEGWRRPWMEDETARAAHAERAKVRLENANELGRYPANVLHDGSDEVLEAFAAFGERGGGFAASCGNPDGNGIYNRSFPRGDGSTVGFGDTGTAARFFYTAKATKAERDMGLEGLAPTRGIRSNAPRGGEADKTKSRLNNHPTVKPLALMNWLVRLVSRSGDAVLDPFMGSGSTGVAADQAGRDFVGIELDSGYAAIARERLRSIYGPLFTQGGS